MNNGLYEAGGDYVSANFTPFNPARAVRWGTVTWTQAIPDEIAEQDGGIKLYVDTTGARSNWTGEWGDPGSGQPINAVSDRIAVKAELTATATETIPEVENVLANGGFETGGLGGWTVVSASNPRVVGTFMQGATPETPYEGAYQFCHDRLSPTEMYQEVPCVNGAQYKFGGWYSWYSDCWNWSGDLELKFYDNSNNCLFSASHTTSSGTNVGQLTYIYKEIDWVAAPPTATKIRAGIRVYGSFIPTWNRWDGFKLQQKAISTNGVPALETPVLDDVSITYLPRTEVLYWREVGDF
jgi:hypothetical protein